MSDRRSSDVAVKPDDRSRETSRGPRRHARLTLALLALGTLVLGGPTAAQAARAAVKPASNPAAEPERIAYGPRLAQRADVYASSRPSSTIVMLVHGGGWRKQTGLYFMKRESVALQAQGFTVYNVNYRQDLNGPAFPAEPEDVMAATRFAIEHAPAYNGNPAKVVFVGGSAGANVAALAAEQLDSARPGTVAGVVSLSGPMDFETLVPLVKNGTITNENLIISIFMALGGSEEGALAPGAWDSIPQAIMRAGSPALRIPGSGCPAWLLFTTEEDLVPASQSREMYSKLSAAHCRTSLQVLPGAGHGFGYWNQVSDRVAGFIAAQ